MALSSLMLLRNIINKRAQKILTVVDLLTTNNPPKFAPKPRLLHPRPPGVKPLIGRSLDKIRPETFVDSSPNKHAIRHRYS